MYLPKKGEICYNDNCATIDHIYSKLNPKRKMKLTPEGIEMAIKYRMGRTRLMCKKCNWILGRIEVHALPLNVLHERSGSRPTPWHKRTHYLGKLKNILENEARKQNHKEAESYKTAQGEETSCQQDRNALQSLLD